MGADVEEQGCFGPYRILRRVGSGGMGSVFEAEDTSLGHRVALKLLHPHVARRPGAVERFLREGRAAARIQHPHVVRVFALGLKEETPYLAMELLRGDDLSQVIVGEGRLSVEGALDLVLPVMAAVAAAHDAGVIHRDLKPSNVCIIEGPDGRAYPKVVDFGVSKVIAGDGAADATVSDSVVGTAAYMAPEQARAAGSASFRSDQYSLGALLYQCLTGKLPFSGANVYEIVEAIMTTPLGAPSAHAKCIPPTLDAAILRAMSRNPDDRFPSVRAFGAALLSLASERARVALMAEFEDSAVGTRIEIGDPEARQSASIQPAPELTTVGGTPTPIPSPSGSVARSSRVPYAVWTLAAALVVGFASMAFGRQPSVSSPVLSPGSPATQLNASDPGRRPETTPQRLPEATVASAATSSPAVAPSPEPRTPPPTVHPQRRSASPRVFPAAVTLGDNGAPILP
jgi:serine/threonine protein kinase